MSQSAKLTPYQQGWNALLDSKSWDDNPWTETTDSGWNWCRGYTDCERQIDLIGSDQVERYQ